MRFYLCANIILYIYIFLIDIFDWTLGISPDLTANGTTKQGNHRNHLKFGRKQVGEIVFGSAHGFPWVSMLVRYCNFAMTSQDLQEQYCFYVFSLRNCESQRLAANKVYYSRHSQNVTSPPKNTNMFRFLHSARRAGECCCSA